MFKDLRINHYENKFIKEWVDHFLSVSNINGIYEGEFWDVVNIDDYWNIIGKNGFIFISKLNSHKKEYYKPEIILRELMFLEPLIIYWFKEYVENKNMKENFEFQRKFYEEYWKLL